MIQVTVLGNNSALPAFGRHPTAQAVAIREQVFLMDCGEGTLSRLIRYGIRLGHIEHIFISHLHGDHYFGLMGLLSSLSLWNRKKPVTVYGPKVLKDIVAIQLDAVGASLSFPLSFHVIDPDFAGMLIDTEHYSVRCFPVNHGVPCHGFVFCEKSAGRRINPEACRRFSVPHTFYAQLKQGADYKSPFGEVVKNETLTFEAPPDKTYAFCADTRYEPNILPFIEEVDLIYHESTFLKQDEEKAYQRYHSTSEQAAAIALKAKAGRLLLGHYSSRYEDILPFEQEAQVVFPYSEASVEGQCYTVL